MKRYIYNILLRLFPAKLVLKVHYVEGKPPAISVKFKTNVLRKWLLDRLLFTNRALGAVVIDKVLDAATTECERIQMTNIIGTENDAPFSILGRSDQEVYRRKDHGSKN